MGVNFHGFRGYEINIPHILAIWYPNRTHDHVNIIMQGVQLYVEVTDVDGSDFRTNSLVDSFAIDIEMMPVGVFTEPKWYNGTFGYGFLELSFKVECSISYFQNCDTSCLSASNCTCIGGFTGSACEINIDECLSANCPNNTVCVDSVNSYRCECLPGFNCTTTMTYCNDSTNCITDSSSVTIDIPSSGCEPGFTGATCATNIDDCIGVNCSGGNGECVDRIDGFTCNCTFGFAGTQCEIDVDDCEGVNCSGHGVCIDDVASFNCSCDPGYTGQLCESEIDDCARVQCSDREECIDGINSYDCACLPEFTGEMCETHINCIGIDCNGNGVCNASGNSSSYICHCYNGYFGDSCEYINTTPDLTKIGQTPNSYN